MVGEALEKIIEAELQGDFTDARAAADPLKEFLSGIITLAANPSVSASGHSSFLSETGTLQTSSSNFSGKLGGGDTFSRSLFHTLSFLLTANKV